MSRSSKPPSEAEATRILLVDDHSIVRQGMRMLISQEPDLVVCGEAASAHEALKAVERTQPNVAVVDLSLKESSGMALIKDLKIRHPKVVVLVVSMRDESFYAERVLRAGAKGYISKEEGTEKLVEGIRAVLTGKVYVSESLAARLLSKYVGGGSAASESPVQRLSDRELEVFEWIGQGLTTREIAEKLHLSVKTIESHREHIKEKLRLDNATELLKHAIEWNQTLQGS